MLLIQCTLLLTKDRVIAFCRDINQLQTISSKTLAREQLSLAHSPHQFGSKTQPFGVHSQLDWERMVLSRCMQSDLIALFACSLRRCHLNG